MTPAPRRSCRTSAPPGGGLDLQATQMVSLDAYMRNFDFVRYIGTFAFPALGVDALFGSTHA